MLDRFIYENHYGRKFDGLNKKVYLNYSELRDYSWEYDILNNKISRFYRSVKERKIPLWVHCGSEAEAIRIKNELYELIETDVAAKKPGKIYVGDYYTVGFITSSVKSSYLIEKQMCKIDLVLTSDDPAWFKEQTHKFNTANSGSLGVGGGTDYPYDYSYDYALNLNGKNIVCNSIESNAFKLLIYGGAENPTVNIGGHSYTVNGVIYEGETLLIDSIAKTITLTTAAGYQINWFDKRSRDKYIFEPIPAGQNTVSWSGKFDFELTVIEKRSEPRWT
jgi:hypothetical protein